MLLVFNSSIILVTVSSCIDYFPHRIHSIQNIILKYGGMPVEEGYLSVTFHIFLTAASEMILLVIFRQQIKEQKHSWSRISDQIITIKTNRF